MNVTAIIVSDLRKKLAVAQAQVTQIQSTLALYGESGEAPRRRRRRTPKVKLPPPKVVKRAAPLAGVAD